MYGYGGATGNIVLLLSTARTPTNDDYARSVLRAAQYAALAAAASDCQCDREVGADFRVEFHRHRADVSHWYRYRPVTATVVLSISTVPSPSLWHFTVKSNTALAALFSIALIFTVGSRSRLA